MVSSAVPNFLPSKHGLHFDNDFPENTPVISATLPLVGEVDFGDAHGGLCGGMVFAVRDFFEAGIPIPAATAAPEAGTPLFEFLAWRLLASFHLPLGPARYYEWMVLSDDGARGVRALTLAEWPAIRAQLDAGHPAPLGLVTVQSLDPKDLGECHQVLAYAYDLDEDSGALTLHVYDPNQHNDDGITLSLNASDPAVAPVYSGDMTVRGFFLTPYTATSPPQGL
jgi:hypothetical protein